MKLLDLNAYRKARIREGRRQRLREVAGRLGLLLFFVPGLLLSIALVVMVLVGVISIAWGWTAAPALVDVGLWYAAARFELLMIMRGERDDDDDDFDAGS